MQVGVGGVLFCLPQILTFVTVSILGENMASYSFKLHFLVFVRKNIFFHRRGKTVSVVNWLLSPWSLLQWVAFFFVVFH